MRKLLAVIAIVVMFVSCSRNAIGPSSEQIDNASHRIYDLPFNGITRNYMASQTKSGSLAGDWINPTNVYLSDNLRASYEFFSASSSDDFSIYDFGFTIPAGATIDGIEVSIEVRANPRFAQTKEISIDGISGTAAKTIGAPNWASSDEIITYGSSTDKWGASSILASDINSSDFGMVISAYSDGPCIAEIDHIEITVYYTEIPSTTVSESQNISLTGSDTTVGATGVLVSETQNIALDASTSDMLGLGLTQSISIEAFDISGSSRENAGIRCISSANDIHVLDTNVNSLIESWAKDFQVNKYEDGHSTIYNRSAWRKTWRLLIQPNDVTRTFVATLRDETDDINFFPTYLFDKSTFYKVRVDNRAPLYYYAGLGDAEELFQLVFYEVT